MLREARLIWAILSGLIAIFLEVTYRNSPTWPIWAVPLQIGISFTLYKLFNTEPAYLTAIAWFNLSALVIRMGAAVVIFHEPMVKGNLAAAVLLFAAVIVGKYWR